MAYLYLAAKFWRECIIVVLAFLLLICLFVQNHQAAEIKDQKQLHADYVAAQEVSIAKAKADAAIQEKTWAEKITKAEQNYNVKIKKIQSDATAAQSAANSLSKQLSIAKQRLSSSSSETVIEYADSSSDILESCITEYRNVAQKADEHAADAERLSNAWP
ncbi:hypothetical protein [Acinetobacter ursingii]|uniref:hypothetical protein n=1 Tax=Acinetobacter ursingii TaxID=108980 RepID=UPI0021CDE674|nr:hypothetical protein [Acinetobacter ursingii]MCU4521925.1 hypothetical protein [Acinetobacter ursingii]